MLKFSGFADLTSCCAGVGTIKAKAKIATGEQHNKQNRACKMQIHKLQLPEQSVT